MLLGVFDRTVRFFFFIPFCTFHGFSGRPERVEVLIKAASINLEIDDRYLTIWIDGVLRRMGGWIAIIEVFVVVVSSHVWRA